MVQLQHEPIHLDDLTAKGIVAANRKMEAAKATVRDEYTVLNQWR